LRRDCFSYLLRELQKIFPDLFPQLTSQARLHFFPNGQSALELDFSRFAQAYPSFSPVFATALSNPALTAHDGKGSSEAGAVHRQHFAELALGNLSGTLEDLEDRVLRGTEPERAEGAFVELAESAGGAPKGAAHAREDGQNGLRQCWYRCIYIYFGHLG
jgi:hypothetical protein